MTWERLIQSFACDKPVKIAKATRMSAPRMSATHMTTSFDDLGVDRGLDFDSGEGWSAPPREAGRPGPTEPFVPLTAALRRGCSRSQQRLGTDRPSESG
jgi:hypothetical protein